MDRDKNELNEFSNEKKEQEKKGDNPMAIIEKELKEMKQLQKQRELTREEIRNAMIKQTIQDNYEALKRLSRT